MQAHFNDPQSYSHHLNGKVQSDRIFPGKSLRRSCVKFPTKKSAYHRKCAFPTIRRIDTPKAAGDARNPPTESAPDFKIGRRFPRRFRQTPTYPAALCISRMTGRSPYKGTPPVFPSKRPRGCPRCLSARDSCSPAPKEPTEAGCRQSVTALRSYSFRGTPKGVRKAPRLCHSTKSAHERNLVSFLLSSASPYAGTHTEVKRLRIAKRMTFVLLMLLYYTAIVNFWKEREVPAAVGRATHSGRDVRRGK